MEDIVHACACFTFFMKVEKIDFKIKDTYLGIVTIVTLITSYL